MSLIFKPEVLSPAGDFERLRAAVTFGADAVYLAGKEFGMRASQANFDDKELKEAVEYSHKNNVRVYVTLNTLPRNEDVNKLPQYLLYLDEIGVDAVIVSDIGVMSLVKEVTPNMEIHISTQAGIVNYKSCIAFYNMGAKRVVLARELSLEEIAYIRKNTPSDLEIEAFVHGAMCMSVSGRCLISNYLTGRDANQGECAQPCRWGYHLVEEKRPNQFYPVFEDEKGSYILNAKDMCMIEHIDKLVEAGITSLKIEGRAKSSYYVSVVTNAYKTAVLDYLNDKDNYKLKSWLLDEVHKVSHRQYSTGFYFDTPTQYYENGGYIRDYDIVAVVDNSKDGYLYCTQKNKFLAGDTLEILQPGGKEPLIINDAEIFNIDKEAIDMANHAGEKFMLKCNDSFAEGSIIRKQK